MEGEKEGAEREGGRGDEEQVDVDAEELHRRGLAPRGQMPQEGCEGGGGQMFVCFCLQYSCPSIPSCPSFVCRHDTYVGGLLRDCDCDGDERHACQPEHSKQTAALGGPDWCLSPSPTREQSARIENNKQGDTKALA